MCGLHGLVDYSHQVILPRVQIHLTAEPGTESLERLLGVILVAIEASVDKRLDADAQRLEKGCNRQCRGGDDEWI